MSVFSRMRRGGAGMATSSPTVPPTVPTRGPILPEMTPEALSHYAAVADAVGLHNGPLLDEQLRHELSAMGLAPFNYEEVCAFLHRMFGRGDMEYDLPSWQWHPLRKIEQDANLTIRARGSGSIGKRQYRGKVPLPVLETVQRLSQALPDLRFYVSGAVEHTNDDPFLLVTGMGVGNYVVEQWDEPNFTGKRE